LFYRKALGVQKKVNKELKDMFNQSAIFDVENLTKILMVSMIERCSNSGHGELNKWPNIGKL